MIHFFVKTRRIIQLAVKSKYIMRLSEFKKYLSQLNELSFKLPSGEYVPLHFHITEIGLLTRNYIDCGGKLREDKLINIQLWYSSDLEHRLNPDKLITIITNSEKMIDLDDHEIEVEYQQETISKFGLSFGQEEFVLTTRHTACLAEDQCGIPSTKPKVRLAEISKSQSCNSKEDKCC